MPTAVSPVQQDLDTATHEAAHAVLAIVRGCRLVRVIAHRHRSYDDAERGRCEWLGGTPFDNAVIALAGALAVDGYPQARDTSDEAEARWLVSDDDLHRARIEAWIALQRRDVQAAIRAVVDALTANGLEMNGVAVEAVARKHL